MALPQRNLASRGSAQAQRTGGKRTKKKIAKKKERTQYKSHRKVEATTKDVTIIILANVRGEQKDESS